MTLDQLLKETSMKSSLKLFRQMEILFLDPDRYGRRRMITHVDMTGKVILCERIGDERVFYKAKLYNPNEPVIIESSRVEIPSNKVKFQTFTKKETGKAYRAVIISAATHEERDHMRSMAFSHCHFPKDKPFKVKLSLNEFQWDPVAAREKRDIFQWVD